MFLFLKGIAIAVVSAVTIISGSYAMTSGYWERNNILQMFLAATAIACPVAILGARFGVRIWLLVGLSLMGCIITYSLISGQIDYGVPLTALGATVGVLVGESIPVLACIVLLYLDKQGVITVAGRRKFTSPK